MSTRRKNHDFMPTDWYELTFDPSTGHYTTSSTSQTATDDGGGDVDGRGKGWLASLWNKWTGAGTTAQQDALNNRESYEAQLQRDWSSSEAAADRRFKAEQAQLDYDRQVEFYERYQSIGAQMRQYKEAGLNPSLLAGGVSSASSAPSGSAPSGSMPSGAAAGATSPMSSPMGLSAFLSSVLNLVKLRSEIDFTKSRTRKNLSESNLTDKTVHWYDVVTGASVDEVRQRIKESAQNVNESLQRIKESASRIDVNNNTIQVGNARIALIGSEKELNVTKSALNRLDAQKAQLLMPYIQSRAEAEQELIKAQTTEARNAAEKHMYDANVSFLKGMVEADLIDQGYYDSLVSSQEWKEAQNKRDYKWSPVNDVCSNLSKICVGVGSVVGAFKGSAAMPMVSMSRQRYVDNTEVPEIMW